MPATDIDVVRDLYAAFQRDDWNAILAVTSRDVEFETDPRHPHAGVYRGLEQVRSFIQEQDAMFEQAETVVDEVFRRGDYVVALLTRRVRPFGSDADVQSRIAHLCTVCDGKVTRVRGYAVREQALAAADATLTRSGLRGAGLRRFQVKGARPDRLIGWLRRVWSARDEQESVAEYQTRASRSLQHRDRAVTPDDFDALVSTEFPGTGISRVQRLRPWKGKRPKRKC